jgi:hypothetical protein
MKIKALLVSAALGAAMVSSASAQVYSANAVGYVNMTIPAGFSIIANPLNGSPDNDINTVLLLPPAGDAATVYRYNTVTGAFGQPIQYIDGLGWLSFDPDPNALLIVPGEAFFITCPVAVDVTWVGEVPQGELSNPLPANNKLSIRSSQVPQTAQLGSPGVGLEFPGADADTVYIYSNAAGAYKQPYQFIDGLGWLSFNGDDEGTDGPTIPVGTGFFIQRQSAVGSDWNRTFSVNN